MHLLSNVETIIVEQNAGSAFRMEGQPLFKQQIRVSDALSKLADIVFDPRI